MTVNDCGWEENLMGVRLFVVDFSFSTITIHVQVEDVVMVAGC